MGNALHTELIRTIHGMRSVRAVSGVEVVISIFLTFLFGSGAPFKLKRAATREREKTVEEIIVKK